jgi:hydrogenase/urease accessory protein HupE
MGPFTPVRHSNRIVIAAVVTLVGAVVPAAAHPAPFSYVDVQLQPNSLDLTLVVHVFDIAHELGIEPVDRVLDPAVLSQRADAIGVLLRERLRLDTDGGTLAGAVWSAPEPLVERQSLRLRARYPLTHPLGAIIIDAALFPYDPVHQTFVNVYEDKALVTQAILSQERTRFEHTTGTRQGTWAVVQKFTASGIHHILIGPDHMLFLIGLLLLGGSVRRLIVVVSAFTLAHSITLSLAALNIVDPPSSVVEPAIALSIVFIGVDNLIVRGGRDLRAWIAFAFGFVHGFGFAGVLREMGLESRALVWSLLSFNLGVEIGQLLVVVVIASALAMLRATSETAGRRLAFAGSLGVIAAGTFWFFERVFFPGGMA